MHLSVGAALGVRTHGAASGEAAPIELLDVMTEPAPAAEEPLAQRGADTATLVPAHPQAARTDARVVHAVAATARKSSALPADAPAVVATDYDLPHFTIVTSNGSGASQPLANAAGKGAAGAPPDDDVTYGAEAVDVPARAVAPSTPHYPSQAQAEGREANVGLEIVLSKTGAVEDVRSPHPAGHGFDEEALAFARKTRFSPAMKRGRPVAVRMIWTVRFVLE